MLNSETGWVRAASLTGRHTFDITQSILYELVSVVLSGGGPAPV